MKRVVMIAILLSVLLTLTLVEALNREAGDDAPLGSSIFLSDSASSAPSAPSSYRFHEPILIQSNEGFTSDNGVTGGNGTSSNPFIIGGWEVIGSSPVGIQISFTDAYFTIRNVYIHLENSSFGIVLSGVANGRVEASEISNSTSAGTQIYASSNVSIFNSDLKSAGSGIHVVHSHQVTVTGNSLRASGDGVSVEQSEDVVISSNDVSGNNVGIFIVQSSDVLVIGNDILDNGEGIVVQDSTRIRTHHNNFIHNVIQANAYRANETFWDNGYPAAPHGGNFWSDYVGEDNCTGPAQDNCTQPDRIGDTPYMISLAVDSNDRDRYPLMAPIIRDTSPPSWPSGSSLTARNITQTSLSLVWTTAGDDSGFVYNYRIYQGTRLLTTFPNRLCAPGKLCYIYDVKGLLPGTTYSFKVEAGDAMENWSSTGPSLSVTTAPISNIVITVTTNKHEYYRGEAVIITTSATNKGDHEVSIDLPSSCFFDIRIWDSAGFLKFVRSRYVGCDLVMTHFDLAPGENVSEVFLWSQTVQPGRYTIAGEPWTRTDIPPGSINITIYSDIVTEGVNTGLSYRTVDGVSYVNATLYFPDGCYEVLDWGSKFIPERLTTLATAFDYHGSSPFLACREGTYEVAHTYELGKLQPGAYAFELTVCLRSVDFQQGACKPAGAVSFTVESTQQPSPASGSTGNSSQSIFTWWHSYIYAIGALVLVGILAFALAVRRGRTNEARTMRKPDN